MLTQIAVGASTTALAAVCLLAGPGTAPQSRLATEADCRVTEQPDLTIEAMRAGMSCVQFNGTTLKIDTDLTIGAKQLAGPLTGGYGMMFGRLEKGALGQESYYSFVITGDGRYRLRFWDGLRDTTLIDWSRHSAIRTGLHADNALRVITQGAIIRLFVNDAYVGGHRSPAGAIGGIGYVVDEGGIRAQFPTLVARTVGPLEATVPTPGRVLFEDDLVSRQTMQVGGSSVCRAGYDNEGYVVEAVSPMRGFCDLPLIKVGTLPSHVRVEVLVKLRSGPLDRSFGVFFGRDGPINRAMYLAAIDGQGTFQLAHRVQTWQRLTRLLIHEPIRKGLGVWNKLTLEVRGQTMRGYVNGELTGTATAPSLVRGQAGFYLDLTGMVAVFRDLRVTEN
jgi:hypothetical protein